METVREFWKRHVEWFGKEPDMPTIAGYAGVMYFEIAAEKVGRDLTREKFIDALESFRDVQDPLFGGPPLTFTSTNHQGPDRVFVAEVQKGRYVKITDFIDFRK